MKNTRGEINSTQIPALSVQRKRNEADFSGRAQLKYYSSSIQDFI